MSSTPPTSPGSDSSWVHVDNEEEKKNLEEEDDDDEDDTPVRIVVRNVFRMRYLMRCNILTSIDFSFCSLCSLFRRTFPTKWCLKRFVQRNRKNE